MCALELYYLVEDRIRRLFLDIIEYGAYYLAREVKLFKPYFFLREMVRHGEGF